MNHQNIEAACKQLRLSGLALTLNLRLQEATANRLAHEEFLELLLQDELNVRKERLLARRTKDADFRHLKTLEEFDWRFNPAIPRKQIYDLATGQFIGKAIDILFLGPPGVGKTHLAQALGYEAIKMNFQVLYRSIFDLVRDFLRDEAFNQQDDPFRCRIRVRQAEDRHRQGFGNASLFQSCRIRDNSRHFFFPGQGGVGPRCLG